MIRECTRCRRQFTPPDLVCEQSRDMETERKSAGLEGIRFWCYRCPVCKMNDIFVDVLPLEGEPDGDFLARLEEMQGVVRQIHADQAEAVVVPHLRR